MEWIDTPESSTINGFGYEAESQVLVVEFKNGGRYNYYDVPAHLFEQMRSAGSRGQFLAQSIKGLYRYARA
jgi:hypothetical protein